MPSERKRRSWTTLRNTYTDQVPDGFRCGLGRSPMLTGSSAHSRRAGIARDWRRAQTRRGHAGANPTDRISDPSVIGAVLAEWPACRSEGFWSRLTVEAEVRRQRVIAAAEVEARHRNSSSPRRSGIACEGTLAASAELDANLIVLGALGRHGWRRALLGGVAEKVVRLSSVPGLTVRHADSAEAAGGE